MKQKLKEFPINGQPVSEVEDDNLIAVQVKQAERNLEIMTDLDKISEPLETIIYNSDGRKWQYRNKGWRNMVLEMDKKGKEELMKFITEKK